MTTEPIDWREVDLEMVRQIHRQGEEYLKAQLQCAIASDQRAVTLAGTLAATSAALFAAAIAFWQAGNNSQTGAAIAATAAVILLGAGSAVWAARPISFMFPGNDPAQWYDSRQISLHNALGGEAENYSQHIATNNAILAENQAALMLAMVAAVLAPIAGIITWMVAA